MPGFQRFSALPTVIDYIKGLLSEKKASIFGFHILINGLMLLNLTEYFAENLICF